MGKSLNKIMLIGNLGRDPEMRFTPSGRPVTTFTLATSRSWKAADGEQHSETEWFSIVVWGNMAETCKKCLQKGQMIYVEGRLQTRRWDDQDGHTHITLEVVANDMMLLGERKDNCTTQSEISLPYDLTEEYPF